MKKTKLLRNFFWLSLSLLLCTGFRAFDKEKPWTRLSRTPAVNTKLFVIYEEAARKLVNDLPLGDTLTGSGPISVEQAMDTIFKDYNDIEGAYVTLVDKDDTDYNTANAERRTIYVYNRGASGASSGQADFKVDSEGFLRCEISIVDSMYEKATSYIRVVTHEIGHCLGLDHPQEITKSIMSYFADDDLYRLQIDDKMGIIFLYPTDPGKADEDGTMGLSCSRR